MRPRKGISSIYGFIMIFLLSMASIQTWSSAVSSMASIETASDQGHQLQQMQSIEHLSLTESGGNLSISNNGDIPSTVEYLRLVDANGSRTVTMDANIAVGSTMSVPVASGYTVEAVTSLGNVFSLWPPADPPGSVWSGTILDDGLSNAQLFQGPYSPSSFFLAEGPSVYAFSDSGVPEWSFDAGSGFVTDVMPLSNGYAYVSVGYASSANVADLFELSSAGSVMQTFPVRLFQTPDGGASDSALPVTKGQDSSYALYDGWFYPESGTPEGLTSDSFPLATSDASDFYFYAVSPVSDDNGCPLSGNKLVLSSYSPESYGFGSVLNWADYTSLGSCNLNPQQLIGSAIGGGAIAVLLASPAYSVSSYEQYPGQNPFLVVVSSSGVTLYGGQAPNNGYSAIATNGADIYLALPQAEQVQAYSLITGSYATYNIDMQASQLIFQDGHLFAISSDQVKVFDSSMHLEKTIELAPLSLVSYSDSFLQESALQAPSFLVLNATTYAALLVNATGFSSLVIGNY
jgi:hypothetical protein